MNNNRSILWFFVASGSVLIILGIWFITVNPYPIFNKADFRELKGSVIRSTPVGIVYGDEEEYSQPHIYIISIFLEKSEAFNVSVAYQDSLQMIVSAAPEESVIEWKHNGVPLLINRANPDMVVLDNLWENIWPGIMLCIIGAFIVLIGWGMRSLVNKIE
jgi:hypothetical protein